MKNYILGFISCFVLFLVVGVSAAIVYSAKDISFTSTDTDWTATNIEDAMNDLNTLYNESSFYKLQNDNTGWIYSGDYNGECTMTSIQFTKTGNYTFTFVVGDTSNVTDTYYYYINNTQYTLGTNSSTSNTFTLTLDINKDDIFRLARTRSSQNGWTYLYSLDIVQN